MAEKRAKHAFGQSTSIEAAKQANKIDAFDILFLDGDTDPKIGWLDANGNTVIVPNKTDLSGVEAELATKATTEQVTEIKTELSTKADATEVNSKIEQSAQDTVATANAYTDKQIETAIADNSGIDVVEF